jgi:hypothetical protein
MYVRHQIRCRAYQLHTPRTDMNPATLPVGAHQMVWGLRSHSGHIGDDRSYMLIREGMFDIFVACSSFD